ncbi:hypothetical protein [Leisingera daeponensis]|uniref:hypothetical protein n=1 Tax=Leisingera daeponensis TaxID=405746 RepID=UPI001C967A67|nr:hypothetical protein [Leisingera daeponensis]MBY6059425.1 hypothetical protein [Leisingera daeponensis]
MTISDTPRPTLLILSGAYCNADLAAEFGTLPPAFLPIGNRRLYESQIELAETLGANVVLTLPGDFDPKPEDISKLDAAGVRVIYTPTALSLSEACYFALEILNLTGPLFVLFGDTLVECNAPATLDCAWTHITEDYFNWADTFEDPQGRVSFVHGYGDGRSPRKVACGYFGISNPEMFIKSLRTSASFMDAVNYYSATQGMVQQHPKVWYDFGHLSLFYRSKRMILVSRAFNNMRSDGVSVVKSSSDGSKMLAEADWFATLPRRLMPFVPQYFGMGHQDGKTFYELEYLYHPILNELFVYGNLPIYVWRRILGRCMEFLETCQTIRPTVKEIPDLDAFAQQTYDQLIVQKTFDRVNDFLTARGWSKDHTVCVNGWHSPGLAQVAEDLIKLVPPTTRDHISFWHGDFFFGNIFYDFRSSRIKVIDPRGGAQRDKRSHFGDWRYDFAKLSHSVMGGYDLILANYGQFEVHSDSDFALILPQTTPFLDIKADFQTYKVGHLSANSPEITALTALLFLTMLPLHAENTRRQDMFLANALLIYRDLVEPPK